MPPRIRFSRPAIAAAMLLSPVAGQGAGQPLPSVDNDWFRAWPPASVAFSFPSTVHRGDTPLGEVDTLEFRATYIESVRFREEIDWLLGVDGHRLQSSVPPGAPIPNALQAIAPVLGLDWRFDERWRARLEWRPGLYSDFAEITDDDVNLPASIDLSYTIHPGLLVGAQLSVNPRREFPVLGAGGVRWRFADGWLLSLWFPRPRLEFVVTDQVTLFGGVTFSGNTFVVADDFGTSRGRPELDGETVDFQEVRAGGGIRYTVRDRLGLELSGGWTIDRRYDFHQRDLLLNGDGAPYLQFALGLLF